MYRSNEYLDFVRTHPCCHPRCMAQADHAHHFDRKRGGGGVGLKSHDTFTVPLCARHHDEIHQHGGFGAFNFDRFNTNAHLYQVALRILTAFLESEAV